MAYNLMKNHYSRLLCLLYIISFSNVFTQNASGDNFPCWRVWKEDLKKGSLRRVGVLKQNSYKGKLCFTNSEQGRISLGTTNGFIQYNACAFARECNHNHDNYTWLEGTYENIAAWYLHRYGEELQEGTLATIPLQDMLHDFSVCSKETEDDKEYLDITSDQVVCLEKGKTLHPFSHSIEYEKGVYAREAMAFHLPKDQEKTNICENLGRDSTIGIADRYFKLLTDLSSPSDSCGVKLSVLQSKPAAIADIDDQRFFSNDIGDHIFAGYFRTVSGWATDDKCWIPEELGYRVSPRYCYLWAFLKKPNFFTYDHLGNCKLGKSLNTEQTDMDRNRAFIREGYDFELNRIIYPSSCPD